VQGFLKKARKGKPVQWPAIAECDSANCIRVGPGRRLEKNVRAGPRAGKKFSGRAGLRAGKNMFEPGSENAGP